MTQTALEKTLSSYAREGGLYRAMPDGRIQCFACGHRCPIPEGKAGVCRVRFNRGGKLYVPSGYVAALQDDPIEKKPFFHALPGARALSFGMLGCDFHCGYCFLPETRIATSAGPVPIGEIAEKKLSLEIYSHKGRKRKIDNFFKRPYRGAILNIKPAFLPAIECTPEHPFFARLRPDRFPEAKLDFVKASDMGKDHCLAVPKKYEFSENIFLDAREWLAPFVSAYRVNREIPIGILEKVAEMTEEGRSSRAIGSQIGKSGSHVRHLRRRLKREGGVFQGTIFKKAVLIEDGVLVRFSKEHAPGIPKKVHLDEDLAELLGFYCAEGSIYRHKNRVHAATLSFSFSKKERDKVERVCRLIKKIFGVNAYAVNRTTTLAAVSSKTSLALLFKALCGGRGTEKKVPAGLFNAKREVVERFLNAYVAGDGYRAPDGQVRISTVSQELAWGIAWLVQKLGFLPQSHRYPAERQRLLLGRTIHQAPWTYLVRWYEMPKRQRHVWEDEDYRYVLIEKMETRDYEGLVYNLETEIEHTYLANFAAVHNCQNWITSQAVRDPEAGTNPQAISAAELADLAIARGCEAVVSTYNEPLITSEWAVQVFKEAKNRGLVTGYVSNGNATPEVLDYIRPWTDLYKVDLKSFNDRHYRELGGTLENVCQSIRDIHARGFWLEVLTLLIPGFNDSEEELKALTEFLVSVSPDIPWHVTAFHRDYKMTEPENTTSRDLLRAAEIAKTAGIRYIYAGNIPGKVGEWENTRCPSCHEVLIERAGFGILRDRLTSGSGRCPDCGIQVPGFWKKPLVPRPSRPGIRPIL